MALTVIYKNQMSSSDANIQAVTEAYNNALNGYATISNMAKDSSDSYINFVLTIGSKSYNLQLTYYETLWLDWYFAYDSVKKIIVFCCNLSTGYVRDFGRYLTVIKDGNVIAGFDNYNKSSTSIASQIQMNIGKNSSTNAYLPYSTTNKSIFSPICNLDTGVIDDSIMHHILTPNSYNTLGNGQESVYKDVYQYNGKRYVGVNPHWIIQSDVGNETFYTL